ncbi:hypothetical protein FEM48_Zijuj12G0114600 [Ziziphus jujuba var. spinosa]|uniref:Uncharacterized protein n=1 Tax=Ziziphus jujuba var. spinosa TaxID=714518 RepID=A0A978UD18_ZIZJJ|nr:hypothetical protein FEM48_Zijuj12G0114600 [Ziziphus jujuba var. spinosa]
MNGEELAGPAGPKLVRLLYFLGAGYLLNLFRFSVICVASINKWRDLQRKSMVLQQQQQQQQQQNQENPANALK